MRSKKLAILELARTNYMTKNLNKICLGFAASLLLTSFLVTIIGEVNIRLARGV